MMRLGITGGIGSGKSFVCRLLQAMAIPVYNCDQRAKGLYDTHEGLRLAMIQRFGAEIYNGDDGKLNRVMLASLIFDKPELLREVNSLVHPLVREDIDLWLRKHESHQQQFVVIESAILLNSEGLRERVDTILAVTAPKALRLQRAILRDGLSRIDVEQRLRHQLPDESLEEQADFVLQNDGIKPLLPQLEEILQTLLTY